MEAWDAARLHSTRRARGAPIHCTVVEKTYRATGPGAGAVAGWRALFRRRWEGG